VHVSVVSWDWKLLGLIKVYEFVLPAYVDTISHIRRPIINARFRLKNVFRLTFRYYFIVILVYSVSLARLGTSFIYMWIK